MNILNDILTLDSLKEITHAFDTFVTVEGSNLPPYYKGIFPHTCECDGEIIMTANTSDTYGYTQLQCCNPDCWVKMAHKFSYFAKYLGFKGFGSTGAMPLYRELYKKFEYPSFLYIFKLPNSSIQIINGDAYADAFESMRVQLKTQAFQFKDAIVSLGIPDIGKNSNLFDVIKSPSMLINVIIKKRLDEVCQMCGIYALKTRYYLEISSVDIVTLLSEIMPHVLSTPKKEIHLAITGSVMVEGEPLTRSQFIWKCESLLDKDGQQAYKLVETKAESKLEYVVADGPSSSSKYKLGQKLDNLITADDFYTMLKQSLGG